MSKNETPKKRKIHVDLPEDVHQKLRVKAALEDMSIQAFVGQLVATAVKNLAIPNNGGKTSNRQSSNL